MTTTDRPYPFFSVNAEKFIAREGEYDVEYDLGQCWVAYNDIVELYEAAANAVDGGSDKEMEKLRDVVIKVNNDFKKAGLMIDVKEIVTKKPRWERDRPDDSDKAVGIREKLDRLHDLVKRLAHVAQDALDFAEAMSGIVPDNPERAKARREIETLLHEASEAIVEDGK